MRQSAPRKIRPYHRQALRDCEDRRSEKGIDKPITALPQQISCSHRVPSAEMCLGDPVNDCESGGQDPCGRNQHPWSKKWGLKTFSDSHRAKVLQAEPGGKSGGHDHRFDDRSRHQSRRSRIHSCRITFRGLDYGADTISLSIPDFGRL